MIHKVEAWATTKGTVCDTEDEAKSRERYEQREESIWSRLRAEGLEKGDSVSGQLTAVIAAAYGSGPGGIDKVSVRRGGGFEWMSLPLDEFLANWRKA